MKDNVVIARGGAFVLSDPLGNFAKSSHGFYTYDTRVLKDLRLGVNGLRARLLRFFEVKPWRSISSILFKGKKYEIIVVRDRLLKWNMAFSEKLTLYNLLDDTISLNVFYSFDSFFEDIFEVRGHKPVARSIESSINNGTITYIYRGRDSVTRILTVEYYPEARASLGRIEFEVNIEPKGVKELNISFRPIFKGRESSFYYIPHRETYEITPRVWTDNSMFNEVLMQSLRDILRLTAYTKHGPILLAGIPYFACIFGRDSIFSSLFLLPYYPEYARGTLRVLADNIGKTVDKYREEEPGKIPHEMRLGELAWIGEIPFSKYYGSIDSTPLFIILAGEYLNWTGDMGTIKQIADSITQAVNWILDKLDAGGGYLRYSSMSAKGLKNQGWKDSAEGILDEEGKPLVHPVALVEVQGYVYAALNTVVEVLGDTLNVDLSYIRDKARDLRSLFNRDFWVRDKRFYALALDGRNKPSTVISSNPGHLLYTDLAYYEEEIADRLFQPDMYSGWGIRTLSSLESAYNPFSYHNGSVWPHDNAFITLGLAKIGKRDYVSRIAEDFFSAGYKLGGLPELFSGLPRDETTVPIPVPRANYPQAWSAAAIYAIVTAIAGINVSNGVIEKSPSLPRNISRLKIKVIFRGEEKIFRFSRNLFDL